MLRSLLACLALSFAAAGCVGVGAKYLPPSEAVRAQFNSVAVVTTARQIPFKSAPTPPQAGAGDGAVEGFKQGFAAGFIAQQGFFLVSPVLAVAGAGVGAVRARSSEDVEAAHAALRDAVFSETPALELAQKLQGIAERESPGRALTIVELPDLIPGTAPADKATNRASYQDLSLQGHDTVLEVHLSYNFEDNGEISPDVWIHSFAVASIFDLKSQTELYAASWSYDSEAKNYFDLAADDAAMLRSEFQTIYEKIADRIVYDLFVADAAGVEADEREDDVEMFRSSIEMPESE